MFGSWWQTEDKELWDAAATATATTVVAAKSAATAHVACLPSITVVDKAVGTGVAGWACALKFENFRALGGHF